MIAIKSTTTNTLSEHEMEIVIELEDGRCIIAWHHDDHDDETKTELDTLAIYASKAKYLTANNETGVATAFRRIRSWYDSCSLPERTKGKGPIAIKKTSSWRVDEDESGIHVTLDDDASIINCRSFTISAFDDSDDRDGYESYGEVTTYRDATPGADDEPFDTAALPPNLTKGP